MLTTDNYNIVRQWLHDICGVELGERRQTMVQSRLARRVTALGLNDTNDYVIYLKRLNDPTHLEWTHMVDILTTHETYFFREGQHFDFLKQFIFPKHQGKKLKILSAACSSGEEAYSIAFEAAAALSTNTDWQVYGTDIAKTSIEQARKGLYSEQRTKLIPEHYRKHYLLKGFDDMEGFCLVKKSIKKHVNFFAGNILETIKHAPYDVIFCRNVLIYFDSETKQKLVSNLINQLTTGGYLIISQTEQLRNYVPKEYLINTSIARKPNDE